MTINKKTHLLVISPHPDDEALGVGGLIGKVIKEKGKVMIVYVCVGSSRQLVTKRTRGNTRLQEIDNVKKLTGAEVKIFYVGKEFTRLDMVPQKDIIERIEDTVEKFTPDIVAVPSSSSYNQDHRAVFNASIAALRPTPKNIRHFVANVLEYFEPYFWGARSQKEPNMYLDLGEKLGEGDLFDFKIGLYKCHATQVRDDPFPRSVENLERLAHIYGKEIGVERAEIYHLLREIL